MGKILYAEVTKNYPELGILEAYTTDPKMIERNGQLCAQVLDNIGHTGVLIFPAFPFIAVVGCFDNGTKEMSFYSFAENDVIAIQFANRKFKLDSEREKFLEIYHQIQSKIEEGLSEEELDNCFDIDIDKSFSDRIAFN